MENASRALIMAGGVLLVMLIVALLLFSRGRIEEFYSKDEKLIDIEDISKFNLQFTNYEKRDVYGYEIISLANKVADYNMRFSNVANAQNDEKYTPITMTVSLDGKSEKLSVGDVIDEKGNNLTAGFGRNFFGSYNASNNPMVQSSVRNDIIAIIEQATQIETFYRDSTTASKLAKSINTLILSKEQLEYNYKYREMPYIQSKTNAIMTYNRIVGNSENQIEYKSEDIDYNQGTGVEKYVNDKYEELINTLKDKANVMKYYEYYQFKKGIFKCTNIEYDSTSNRVKTIDFKFTGNIQ